MDTPEDIKAAQELSRQIIEGKLSDLQGLIAWASAKLKAQKAAQKELLEKNQGQLAELTKSLMTDVEGIFQSYLETATELIGDKAQISVTLDKSIWKASVMKSTAKGASKGGSKPVGKYNMSTEDLLKLHGDEEMKEGVSFQQAMEDAKVAKDSKNATYQVRIKLIEYHQKESA